MSYRDSPTKEKSYLFTTKIKFNSIQKGLKQFVLTNLVEETMWLLVYITPGGGGGTPLYKPYRYVPTQRVRFLVLFGLKTGIHFAHFGLESGMVFERTTGVYDVFIVSIPNE